MRTAPAKSSPVGRLRIAQDVVLGWLFRIANGPFQSWRCPPGLHPGVFSAVATGLDLARAVLTQTRQGWDIKSCVSERRRRGTRHIPPHI